MPHKDQRYLSAPPGQSEKLPLPHPDHPAQHKRRTVRYRLQAVHYPWTSPVQKGSVPHRPTFGSDIYKYIDYPINEATPNIVREATDAITMWETRIKVDSINVEINETNIKIKVEWDLKDSNANGYTEITL